MYYDERPAHRRYRRSVEDERYFRPRRRRRRGGLIRFLLRLLLLYVALSLAGSMFYTLVLDGGWTDILLLGIDKDSSGTSRSDTMIVASIGPLGQVRLTSILRDTWVDIPGYNPTKINAAYRYGGPELAMQTVNRLLDEDITNYASVSLQAFPLLVDSLGGIDIAVTEAEMREVNSSLASTRKMLAKTGVDTSDLTVFGESVHLNGAQALAFARIRRIGSDYQRTERQRTVLEAMLTAAKQRPWRLVGFVQTVQRYTKTNVHLPRVLPLGAITLIRRDVRQLRLPADGLFETGTVNGTWRITPDVNRNRSLYKSHLTY